MIIYKTSGNYHKGIKEIEIERVIDDKTFEVRSKILGKLYIENFIPEFGEHQCRFFLTREAAKEHLKNRINNKISELEAELKKAKRTLNSL